MGRLKNDGRGRLGGRTKGTANKPLAPLNEWVLGMVNRNRSRFEKDVETLTPQERAAVLGPIIAATVGGTLQEPEPLNP